MIEVGIFTVVIARPGSPSVVVLVEKATAAGETLSFLDAISDAPSRPETAAQQPITPFGAEDIEPKLLPIWIGYSEAEAIMNLLEKKPNKRPLTNDLLANVIGALGSSVKYVVIDKVIGTTFFANICLDRDGRLIHIDARPSDSIALALCTGARIFVDEDVINAAAHHFMVKISDGGELLYGSEMEMERFHSFIESVSPEDFTL